MNYNNLIDLTALKYWFEEYAIPSFSNNDKHIFK